jgi:hypothetical protein
MNCTKKAAAGDQSGTLATPMEIDCDLHQTPPLASPVPPSSMLISRIESSSASSGARECGIQIQGGGMGESTMAASGEKSLVVGAKGLIAGINFGRQKKGLHVSVSRPYWLG